MKYKKNKENKRNKAIFYVVTFSLLFCICFAQLTACNRQERPSETTPFETPLSPVTSAPETTVSPSTSTPETTKSPETTPDDTTTSIDTTPEDTTTKSPETTELPAPIANSGTFKMATGTSLGFRLDYELDKFEDGFAYIDVKVVLTTYELHVSQRKNGVVSFGEESIIFSTDRISYDGKKPTDIVMTVVQVAIPADGDIAVAYLEAKWWFAGIYAGVEYNWLTAGGYVCVQKP